MGRFYRRAFAYQADTVTNEEKQEILKKIEEVLELPKTVSMAVLDATHDHFKWADTVKYLQDAQAKAQKYPSMFTSTFKTLRSTCARFSPEALVKAAERAAKGVSFRDEYLASQTMQEDFRQAVAYYSATGYFANLVSLVEKDPNFAPSEAQFSAITRNKFAQRVIAARRDPAKFVNGQIVRLRPKGIVCKKPTGEEPSYFELCPAREVRAGLHGFSNRAGFFYLCDGQLLPVTTPLLVLRSDVRPVSAKNGSKRYVVMDMTTCIQYLAEEYALTFMKGMKRKKTA